MKKFNAKRVISLVLCALVALFTVGLCSCTKDDSKTITVCASEIPHAEILNGKVKDILKAQGYTLEVSVLDWSIQNDAVAQKDYDANYFQHVPYLNTYAGSVALAATCKVHYEPLGIYYGKSTEKTLAEGRSFIICNDPSNAVRALQLLEAKGVFAKATEGDNYPISESGEGYENFNSSKWTSVSGVEITLIPEENLVASMPDYDFACLPCNTALTGNVGADKRIAVESDPAQVGGKANILAVRKDDYISDETYKTKIDALTDALLSAEVAAFVQSKYNGVILCNADTQIDLREQIK